MSGSSRPKQWYILWKYWHENKVLQLIALDGVYAASEKEVLKYAHEWYGLNRGEKFKIELCLTKREIVNAIKLCDNRTPIAQPDENWTASDWREFESIPTYAGNEKRYLRK